MTPKSENKNKGFDYSVTEEQIQQHQQRTISEIFHWLETTAEFIYQAQTPQERIISKKIKAKYLF